jgi:hypothetical protein
MFNVATNFSTFTTWGTPSARTRLISVGMLGQLFCFRCRNSLLPRMLQRAPESTCANPHKPRTPTFTRGLRIVLPESIAKISSWAVPTLWPAPPEEVLRCGHCDLTWPDWWHPKQIILLTLEVWLALGTTGVYNAARSSVLAVSCFFWFANFRHSNCWCPKFWQYEQRGRSALPRLSLAGTSSLILSSTVLAFSISSTKSWHWSLGTYFLILGDGCLKFEIFTKFLHTQNARIRPNVRHHFMLRVANGQ